MTSITSQTLTTTPSPKQPSTTSLSALWWNTNLPPSDHTPACPAYLTYALTHPKERANLSTLDADFKRLTWPEVRAHVAANRLDQFTRVPSELRRYRQYTEKLVREYGSVMRFVLDERLGWRDSRAGEGRFGCEGMYCFFPCVLFLSLFVTTTLFVFSGFLRGNSTRVHMYTLLILTNLPPN